MRWKLGLAAILAIVALVLATLAERREEVETRGLREQALRVDLKTLRNVITQYQRDTGHCVEGFDSLITAGYLRDLPVDPLTRSKTTWVMTRKETPTGCSVEIRSGARDKALDGSLVATW